MSNNVNEFSVKSLSKFYPLDGKNVCVLYNLNFSVRRGELMCVLGPSGCGKTTLLRLIANLEPQTDGQIIMSLEDHHDESRIGMVFQEQGLFPWMSVRQNIRFVLDNNSLLDERNKDSMVASIVEKLGLTKFIDVLPLNLSGGMRQRVSIGRALANESKILLLDEPFVFLDYQTRLSTQQLLLDLWHEFNMTILFVTHDIEEAVLLGERILVMTPHPGTVKDIIDVSFERSQELGELKRQQAFLDMVHHLSGLIASMVTEKDQAELPMKDDHVL